jgi:uncharacterized membrane protein
MTERIDNFTDAAFAFAVSLLVIGGARAPDNFDALLLSLGDIPAFAFGFALMAMFWLGQSNCPRAIALFEEIRSKQ